MADWLDDAEAAIEVEAEEQKALSDSKEWKPKEGDLLKGKLIQGKHIITKYGPTYIINVQDKDGQVWDVWAKTMIENQLLQQFPAIGKGIAIKFNGMKQGETYKYGEYIMSCEPHRDADEVAEWAKFWRGLPSQSNDPTDVADRQDAAQTHSQQAGLEDPF